MASVVRDPGGRKRVQYLAGNGAKKTIRLGKMDLRQAETVRIKVEALISARITGVPDAETSRWLAALDDRLYSKLVAHGLAPPRPGASPTLAALLDEFFAHCQVKPSTLTTYQQTRRSLEHFFGAGRPLAGVTPLEADRWRRSMRDAGLAEATISKRVKTARQVFRQGVKWKMLAENPFSEIRAGAQTNKDRMFFVTRDAAEKVIDACPDAEWRLIVALSRFGGLRCPSEHLSLRWSDIDWGRGRIVVRSPKTEGLEGREFRVVPLFPELKRHLMEAFEQARPGDEWVIARYRCASCNLRTQLLRVIARAGVSPWPKLFHNMRSSRQTELAETFPAHVVCAWLGNSQAVAQAHYLQVHDGHFRRAVEEPAAAPVVAAAAPKATQNPTQQAAESSRTEPQTPDSRSAQPSPVQILAKPSEPVRTKRMTPTGSEQVAKTSRNSPASSEGDAKSDAVAAANRTPGLDVWLSRCPEGISPALRAVIEAVVRAMREPE